MKNDSFMKQKISQMQIEDKKYGENNKVRKFAITKDKFDKQKKQLSKAYFLDEDI